MRPLIVLAALACTACHSEQTREQIDAMTNNGEIAEEPVAPAAAPAAKAVSIEQKDELVDFSYSWPAEAAAIPTLDKQLRGDADKAKAELLSGAREDQAMRVKDKLEFHQHMTGVALTTQGSGDRLLSLSGPVESFTGGAHPNHGTRAILWDRQADKDVGYAGLFASAAAAFAPIKAGWCSGLDAERKEKRGAEDMGEPGDPFNTCPPLNEISVIPVDTNGDRKFDRLLVRADPYVAGPYAEGDYEVELPITAALIQAMKAEYRAGFAA